MKGIFATLIVDIVLCMVGVALLVPPIPSEPSNPISLFPGVIPGLLVLGVREIVIAWNKPIRWIRASLYWMMWFGIAVLINIRFQYV